MWVLTTLYLVLGDSAPLAPSLRKETKSGGESQKKKKTTDYS